MNDTPRVVVAKTTIYDFDGMKCNKSKRYELCYFYEDMSYDIITDDIIEVARLKRMLLHKGHEIYTVKMEEIINNGVKSKYNSGNLLTLEWVYPSLIVGEVMNDKRDYEEIVGYV